MRHLNQVLLLVALAAQPTFGQEQDHAGDAIGPASQTVTLPAPYTSCTVAGAGRFLAFHLADREEVAVVDLHERRIAMTIPHCPAGTLLAGGRNCLLIVQPTQNLVQRYDLDTLKRSKVRPLAGEGPVERAVMGACGDGPLLTAGREAILLDVDSLQPLEIAGTVIGGSGRYGYALRVSADGRTFTGIPTGYGPVGYSVMRIDGHRTTVASFGSTSHAVRWAQPTADGSLILLPGGQLFSDTLEPLAAKPFEGSTLFPTVDPRYFLSCRFAATQDGRDVTQAAICTVADLRTVLTVSGLEEMAPTGNTAARMSIADRLHRGEIRYHFIPAVKAFVTLPYGNQQVVIRDFDLFDTLDSSGENYLFVDSVPPRQGRRGQNLTYQIAAHSNHGRPKYELQAGPDGMTVGRTGLLKWKVPKDFPAETAAAIIAIRDRANQDLLHSIRIAVQD
jgi:hypothetical protein